MSQFNLNTRVLETGNNIFLIPGVRNGLMMGAGFAHLSQTPGIAAKMRCKMEIDVFLMHLCKRDIKKIQSKDSIFKSVRVNGTDVHQTTCRTSVQATVLHAINKTLGQGAAALRREALLPRLIAIGPNEIADLSVTGRAHVVRRLAKALRGERARGRAGHWSYSLNRHIGLLQAFRSERADLRAQLLDCRTLSDDAKRTRFSDA